MKKNFVMAVLVVATVVFAFAANSFAGGKVTLVGGPKEQQEMISWLAQQYWGLTDFQLIPSSGKNTVVVGPKGTGETAFSPAMMEKLQGMKTNPLPGQGLHDICPLQAGELGKAFGSLALNQKSQKPLTAAESTPACKSKSSGCYGKVLTGRYQTLKPWSGIRVVSNTGNDLYPANTITFKIEYQNANLTGWTYGTGWGGTIVMRNLTMNPYELLEAHGGKIVAYLNKATNLKHGQPGKPGDSCYQVAILRDGTLFMDESPSEAPYVKY